MQIKTGIDIIEIDRIKEAIERHGESFLKTIFTDEEIRFCENRRMQKYEDYAARFAAKEATFKALSFYYETCKWLDYEVLNLENGKPYINLRNSDLELESIDLSISHNKTTAVASVVVLLK